jgi:hypothetical protein
MEAPQRFRAGFKNGSNRRRALARRKGGVVVERTDANGYAYKGSQRQLQDFVNCARSELNIAIFSAIASLPRSEDLCWRSPLRENEYKEYRDAKFLAAVGQTALSSELRRFWPSGGPVWDALAIVNTGGSRGVLLVEAKAHPEELESSCKAKNPDSVAKIKAALGSTKSWLGVNERLDWYAQYYQSTNRLAHLYFLREIAKVPAWLVNLYFVDDASHISTPRVDWDRKIAEVEQCLGLGRVSSPYVGNVFLSSKKIATHFQRAKRS